MSEQNDPVEHLDEKSETPRTVAMDRLVNTIFGPKPSETYAIYREGDGTFRVVEFTERDGQRVQTEREWTAHDIFLARGHVPPRNRVQVKPDPSHDAANLVETWV
jgi:hypothetical protein